MIYIIFCTLDSTETLGVVFGVPALPRSRNPRPRTTHRVQPCYRGCNRAGRLHSHSTCAPGLEAATHTVAPRVNRPSSSRPSEERKRTSFASRDSRMAIPKCSSP
jgi:hypothetical protein